MADALEAQLGSDSARFRYNVADFGQSFGNLEGEVGFLYTDKDTRNNDYLVDAGVLVRGESVEAPIIISIGARAYMGSVSRNTMTDYDVMVVGLGGDALLLPDSWGGFGIGAFFMTAPSVVSFRDADGFTEYGATINFEVSPQAVVKLGYQRIRVDIETNGVGKLDLAKGGFFGIQIKF
ncbi:MAG: hypothetical protein OQK73_11635 [Gammaproteobacteria bacterium]|nr:hypothetical protein [Gammaproteobacteria bacterium]